VWILRDFAVFGMGWDVFFVAMAKGTEERSEDSTNEIVLHKLGTRKAQLWLNDSPA
jgi:hypothetical protein